VEGLAASKADCWLEVRMLLEDPNISQIDQGFSVDFLGSGHLPSQHKLKDFCPVESFSTYILSL
jgi:hypothetical protein